MFQVEILKKLRLPFHFKIFSMLFLKKYFKQLASMLNCFEIGEIYVEFKRI